MKKGILFDLDGTLTDSGQGIMGCADLALAHFGLAPADKTTLRKFVGPPLRESFAREGVPADRIEEAIRIFRDRYWTVGKFENFPYPGICSMLETLRARGHSLYVATSKPEKLAVEVLTHFHMDGYFTRICGASEDSSREKKAQVIGWLLQHLEEKVPLVMVGDTELDILGAAAMGLPAVGVAWGYGLVEEMEAAGAAAIAHTPEELLTILDREEPGA